MKWMRLLILTTAAVFMLPGCIGTQKPILLENIEPEYPREAQELGLKGKVDMLLLVAQQGDVQAVRIQESSGYEILDDAAIDYANVLKFSPAKRRGRPIDVWLTWSVEFKPITTFFQPNLYAEKVVDLIQAAADVSESQRHNILQAMMDEHDEYTAHLSVRSDLNFNESLNKFILPELQLQWEAFWDIWPMRFIVYQDFLARYPASSLATYAREQMHTILIDDIYRIKEAARYRPVIRAKIDIFLTQYYTLLKTEFPDSIPSELQADLSKYTRQ
jgi:TonB family protein